MNGGVLGEGRRCLIVRRKEVQGVAVTVVDISKRGAADANSILQHGGKHGLQIAGRATDDPEHLRSRRLLLQRLCEVGGALAQFVEQPRVLDGDDGLGGKVRRAARSACR